jgi:hypothetical protein
MPATPVRLHRALVLGPAAGVAHQAARLLADRLHRRTGCAVERRDGPPALPEGEDGAGWDAVLVVATDAAP